MKIIISIIILSTLFSCSKEKEVSSIPVIFQTSIIGNQSGGVIIGGTSDDNKMFFQINPTSNEETQVLPIGNWTFYAVGWEGPGIMKGQLRCSNVINQNISGVTASVALTINKTNCDTLPYNLTNGSSHFDSSSVNVKPLRVVTCLGGATGSETADTECAAAPGKPKSFKIFMPVTYTLITEALESTWKKDDNTTVAHEFYFPFDYVSMSFTSECHDFVNSSVLTDYHVPINMAGTDMNPIILTYETIGCPESDLLTNRASIFDIEQNSNTGQYTYAISDADKTTLILFNNEMAAIFCDDYTSATALGDVGGDGTAANPYQICTAAQFNAIGADNANNASKYYELKGNIDLSTLSPSSYNFIGNITNQFTGGLQGNGFTISNLTSTTSGVSYIGIFGYVSDSGSNTEIKNLVLENINFSDSSGNQIGGLIGCINSSNGGVTINNIIGSNISVTGNSQIGGLVGLIAGSGGITISEVSLSSISVTGTAAYVGGAIGETVANTVTNTIDQISVTSGTVTGTNYIGGFIGSASCSTSGSTIENSYTNATVTASSSVVGGFTGSSDASINIINSYATGSVTSSHTGSSANIGGFAGICINTNNINYVFYAGSNISATSATDSVGHLCGSGDFLANSFHNNASICQYNVSTSCATLSTGTAQPLTDFHDAANPPMSSGSWDFTNIWQENGSALPTLKFQN